MPYLISNKIKTSLPGMWGENSAYQKKNLYDIDDVKSPPVNYDTHILNSHSLTHVEVQKHTQKNGKTLDLYYDDLNFFYGKCNVVKIKGNNYKQVETHENTFHWEVSLAEMKEALDGKKPQKILLTTESYPENEFGFHDPNYVLTLSREAAEYLLSFDGFNMYGTSWKSSDFNSRKNERPIHNILFEKAVIMECLILNPVPAGEYFLTAFPLNIEGASESVVSPVLFTKSEVLHLWS